ncbi:MAG: hypothetical protein E6Q97_04365 [Desulfurellales bacterium]|nr:MAG: hypothetical protein E6Q97_04365 [Desulfurellales bacterium]
MSPNRNAHPADAFLPQLRELCIKVRGGELSERLSRGYIALRRCYSPDLSWETLKGRIEAEIRYRARREKDSGYIDGLDDDDELDLPELGQRDTLAAVDGEDLVAAAAERLSPRQRRILAWLRDGWTHDDIAAAMYISRPAVTQHLARIRGVFAELV